MATETLTHSRLKCDKKLKGKLCCENCVYGFYMDNVNRCPSGAFMTGPYVPLIITSTMSDKIELSCGN